MTSASVSRTHSGATDPGSGAGVVERILRAILALCIVGAGIAAYLTYTHYDESALVCQVGSCASVQKSEYSTLGPIPIALLGVGMFVTIAALTVMRLRGVEPLSFEHATIATWG